MPQHRKCRTDSCVGTLCGILRMRINVIPMRSSESFGMPYGQSPNRMTANGKKLMLYRETTVLPELNSYGRGCAKKFFVFLAKRIPIPDLIFRGKENGKQV